MRGYETKTNTRVLISSGHGSSSISTLRVAGCRRNCRPCCFYPPPARTRSGSWIPPISSVPCICSQDSRPKQLWNRWHRHRLGVFEHKPNLTGLEFRLNMSVALDEYRVYVLTSPPKLCDRDIFIRVRGSGVDRIVTRA